MGRKPPSLRKRNPRQELAGDTIAALAAVAGTFDADGQAPPPFIPEGHTSLTDATASIEGGWLKLRQHLYAGRVQGFIRTEQGRLVRVPAKDWGSPENDDAAQTGRAIIVNRAILGGRDLEGFALVKTNDFMNVDPTARIPLSPGQHIKQPAHRPPTQRINAERAIKELYPHGVPLGLKREVLATEVNTRLNAQGLVPVSMDTIDRARGNRR